jgi:hypothetical protein
MTACKLMSIATPCYNEADNASTDDGTVGAIRRLASADFCVKLRISVDGEHPFRLNVNTDFG